MNNSGGVNTRFVRDYLLGSFVESENSHVSREELYREYCEHCEFQNWQALNSASFGKVIRSVFPTVSTRRLGTRGNSKYHYYGIKPKFEQIPCIVAKPPGKRHKTSEFVETSPKPQRNPNTQTKKHKAPSDTIFSTSNLVISDILRLPYPDMSKFPVEIDATLFESFLASYKLHIESLLHLGLQGEFDQFATNIIHFWREMPDQYRDLVTAIHCCRIVAEWDAILYQALLNVLLPDLLGQGDEALMAELKVFIRKAPTVLRSALADKYSNMLIEKNRVTDDFSKIIKQYVHLNHLALRAENAVKTSAPAILEVWGELDFETMINTLIAVCPNAVEAIRLVQENVMHKMMARASISQWAEWLFAMTEEFVPDTPVFDDYVTMAQQFIRRWKYVATLILREINEKKCTKDVSTGCRQLSAFFDEYVKYLVDCKIDDGRRFLESQGAWQMAGAVPNSCTDYFNVNMGDLGYFVNTHFDAAVASDLLPPLYNFERSTDDDYATLSKSKTSDSISDMMMDSAFVRNEESAAEMASATSVSK